MPGKEKLDLGESKDKLEACLSLTFSNLGAKGDLWEKLECFTTELHDAWPWTKRREEI